MALQTSANCKFYIGTKAPASNLTEFQADTYIEVTPVEEIGEFGDQHNIVTFTSLSDGRVRKLKGTKDAGDMTLVVAHDASDAGQVALLAAANDNSSDGYNCKIEYANGEVYYFRGQVSSSRMTVGGADNVIRRNFTIAIDSDVVEGS